MNTEYETELVRLMNKKTEENRSSDVMQAQNDREALLLIQHFRKEYEAEHGRLYTSDEVVALVNDIRKELKEKGKI